MAMVPHGRSLVKRLEGRPFALLGVNGDGDNPNLKQDIERSQITWRSWIETPANPLTSRWQVQGFPTLVLIDAKGVIRQRILGRPDDKDLDRLVDALVKEAETQSPPAPT
jgi:hypothetical protein